MQRKEVLQLNRRQMMSVTGIGSLGALLGTQTLSARPSGAVPRNMNLSLAAYSMRRELTGGQMNLFQFIDWCAEMDLPGTELTSYYFEEGFDAAYLRRLKIHAFRNGVTISGTAIRNDFCVPPGPQRDEEIASVRRWLEHAAELGAPHVRIFAGSLPDGATRESGIKWVADAIREVLPKAEECGVVVGLENHGGITARAQDVLDICKAVGEHPWFGVNLDTGNFHTNPYEELEMVAPLAVNVQIKAEIGTRNAKQPTDLTRIKDILTGVEYKGWVALEYEAEPDPRSSIPRYIRQMKGLFEGC